MNKPKLRFVIQALMFLCLMALAGIGLLMEFVLIPGREKIVKYGQNVRLSFLGLDRNDWGDVHLYIALIFLALLAIHLTLHWKKIVGLYEKMIPDQKRRNLIALAFLLISVILIYFAFLINPEVRETGRGGGRYGIQQQIKSFK
jgi:glucan phosphoethanolaminetransferase (alkaline phosphatase superfamily)